MDVREQERPRLLGEPRKERVHAARRPWIDDQAVDLIGTDHAIVAEVHDIDQSAHCASELTIALRAEPRLPERDGRWVMRTYAGPSDARRSKELSRRNLARGQ